MTTPNLSVRFPAPFPATVAGAGGIAVEKENGVWIIAPDFSALAEILPAALADPSAKQIWVYDPVGNEYNVLTLAGLGSALYRATSATSVAIGVGAKTFTTQPGKDFSIGSFVLATSDADPTNFLLGQVTDYGGTSLTISVAAAGVGGSGTHADWTLRMSSPAGPAGSTGAAGRNAGFRYTWSTNTVSSDPTSGRIKVNNAAPGSATALYISETDAEGNPLANEIASWDDSSDPNVKAQIKISKASAPGTNFLLLNLTATLTDDGAWDSFAVGGGQLVGTLADGDAVDVTIRRTGNKGADGVGAGDVVGPASATDGGFAKYDGTSGKLIKNSAAIVAVADGGTGQTTLPSALAAFINGATQDISSDPVADYVGTYDASAGTGKKVLLGDIPMRQYWAVQGTTAGGVTNYHGVVGNPIEAAAWITMPFAGSITKLYANTEVNVGVGNSVTLTMRKNGIDQAVTCAISGASSTANDTAHSFTFAAGDTICCKAVSSPSVSSTRLVVNWEVSFKRND